MKQKSRVAVHLCRFRRAAALATPTVAAREYEAFFGALYPGMPLIIREVDEDISKDVFQRAADLRRLLLSKKTPRVLILECLDSAADVREYDRMTEAVALALEAKRDKAPDCVLLPVADLSSLGKSVWLKRKLMPACESVGTSLIGLTPGDTTKPTVWVRGHLLGSGAEERMLPFGGVNIPSPPSTESGQNIESLLDFLVGHFAIQVNGKEYHVSHIASIRRLAHDDVFAERLRTDLEERLRDPVFRVSGLGLPDAGIAELCMRVAQGDRGRIVENGDDIQGEAVAIISDFFDDATRVLEVIEKIHQRGARRIAVVSLAGEFPTRGVESLDARLSYMNLPRAVYQSEACPYCTQGVAVVPVCDFDTASRSLGVFDPFTFWRLVGEEKAFSAVGHWGSDRTPNHYYFRIVTKPLFTRYTTALALRLRNVLQERGILPQWVRKLVCTEGEESYILSSALAQVLGLSSRDVIKIPREYFKGITGRDVDRELVKRLESAYGAENLRSKNVLIVDQAAHHFRTFSALRSVCEYFDCTVLGFLVFVDRTTSQIPLGEYLSHSHYVALYSWPCPANRDFECACVKSATSS